MNDALRVKAELERIGGDLALIQGELQIRAPKGMLTPELMGMVENHREALRVMLLDEAEQRKERCAALACEVTEVAERLASPAKPIPEDLENSLHAQLDGALNELISLAAKDPETGDRPNWC